MFTNLEDIASAYIHASEIEEQALFAQGDILAAAVNDGYSVKEIARHIAGLTQRKTRTIYNRYKVASTFPPESRIPGLLWTHYLIASQAEDPAAALALAADNDLSPTALRKAIGKPEYWLRAAEAIVTAADAHSLTLAFEDTLADIPAGASVVVSIKIVQPIAQREAA